MSNLNIQILKYVIEKLHKKKISTDKIIVQKLMFFLKQFNIPISYHFRMYAYGPYSKALNQDTYGLEFEDQLVINSNNYKKGINFQNDLDDKYSKRIDKKINLFIKMVDNKFKFSRMEIFGTTLYCYKALKYLEKDTDFNSVYTEFKAWKKNKHPKDKIKDAYTKIKEFL